MPKRKDLLFSEANIIKEIVNTRFNSVKIKLLINVDKLRF